MISATERKRRQRKGILDMYRRSFSKPFWEAYKEGNSKEMQRYLDLGSCFKLGVYMAAPHGRYGEAFNKIDEELKKEIDGEGH